MRVAYDARPLIEQGTGIGRYVRSVLEALLAFKEMSGFLLCSPREIHRGDLLARDPRVRELVHGGWKGNLWLQVVLPLLLRRHRPDLFHGTLFLPPLRAGVPSVVNIYDLTVYRYPETMEAKNRWFLRMLLPRAVSRADRIITLSEFTRSEIGARWPDARHKIRVVPGAPGLSLGSPSGRAEGEDADRRLRGYGVRRPYLLYVGTMEPRKNVVQLLKAFERVHAMGIRDTQLVLAGHKGWGFGEVRRAWESSPARSSIRYAGYVPDEDLGLLYRNAEVFVYLSLYEGFGLPPLEAMAAGTCVVASNRACLPESLGDAALPVDPLDVESVARALALCLRDEEMRREREDKGLRQSERYSWEKSAARTLRVYGELC